MVEEKTPDQLTEENEAAVDSARKAIAGFFSIQEVERELLESIDLPAQRQGE
jgi:hypothetical protein